MLGVSVIVCCYNSEKRLPETLRHLAIQKIPEGLKCEIIVVNNNSTDATTAVTYSEWAKYDASIDIKVIDEPKPGLSSARERGFIEARFDYVLLCDDDNWLSESYVSLAYKIMQADGNIGVLGGCGIFEPELPINPAIAAHTSYFVNGPQTWAEKDHWVYGAGALYRRTIYLELKKKGWRQIMSDRTGKKLLSGGDVEICFMFFLSGYKIIADDRLKFKHFVPKDRQNYDYILNLSFWLSYSYVLLHSYVVTINQDKTGLAYIYYKWFRVTAGALYPQAVKLTIQNFNANNKLSSSEKITFKSNLGVLYSILKNFRKIKKHSKHVEGVLKLNN